MRAGRSRKEKGQGRMKPIEWKSDTEFSVDGVKFLCSLDDTGRKTNSERIIILKDRASLQSYSEVLGNDRVRNILEFGILEGGSAVLFALLLQTEKFVGIDIEEWAPGVEPYLEGKNIKFHFGVSQSDERRVREIIQREFQGPLDLIIDDASHLYGNTKRSFEVAFPHLRPGGLYVIEDWGWAHWRDYQHFRGLPAMSMLIFELVMLCASSPQIIADVRIFPSFAFIRKSQAQADLGDFAIGKHYQKRGL